MAIACRGTLAMALLCLFAGCSPRHLIVNRLADELAGQAAAPEDDLVLAREASAFYLKMSESVLRQTPGHGGLAESVAAGFTQYAYAFAACEADRIEARDLRGAQRLRQRAARLYLRAHRHAMNALELQTPGFRESLASRDPARWPRLADDQVGLAYWAAASWGGLISQSKDEPDTVADLPLATRLARLAWDRSPQYGNGSLATLMGSFEAARPGGSLPQAAVYFDAAIAAGAGKSAGPFVAKAEAIALPANDRRNFEALLRQALSVATASPDLANEVMRERARWLLETADDLF